jgi:hypothetical protein
MSPLHAVSPIIIHEGHAATEPDRFLMYSVVLTSLRSKNRANCGLQEEAFATGIDTGVVSWSYLTGLLLPGAKDLQERPGDGSGPMTLAKLHGKFIRVKAKKNYLAAGHDECMPYRLCRE